MEFVALKILIVVNLFLAGAIIASFLGNVAQRQSWKKTLFGRSKCEKCKKKLSFIALLPVIGWIAQKGKCPKCGYKVPVYYPVGEFLLGSAFASTGFMLLWQNFDRTSFGIQWGGYAVLFSVLYYFSIYDVIHLEIPDKTCNVLSVGGLVYLLYQIILERDGTYFVNVAICVVLLALYWILLKLLKREYFGFGDIRFLVMLLLWMPWIFVVSSFWLGIMAGGVVAVVFIAKNWKNWRGKIIPYIPILCTGFWLCVLLHFDNVVNTMIETIILYMQTQ